MVGFHLQRCWALSSFPFYSVSRDTTHSVVRAIGVDDDNCEDRNANWQSILGTFKMEPKRLIRIETPPTKPIFTILKLGQNYYNATARMAILTTARHFNTWTLEYWETTDRLQHHLNIILVRYLEYLWSKYVIVVGFPAKRQEEDHLHR